MASSSSSPMQANGYSVITIASLEETVNGTKWLLNPSAGKKSCCIFRVPQCLIEINNKTYRPHIVSIGPYHHGEPDLEMMQQHKRRFLRDLLARTPPTGPGLGDYQQAVASMEQDIRGCYQSTLKFCRDELVDMMVLDGLFIIELFCKVAILSPSDPDEPIFKLAWIFSDLVGDLFRLENQIPFLVLQTLFDKSKASRQDSDSSLVKLTLRFFNYAVQRPEEVLEQHSGDEGRHLLDLFRLSLIPQPKQKPRNGFPLSQLLQSVKKPLSRINSSTRKSVKKFLSGIKFKIRRGDTSSTVQFIPSAKKLHLSGIKFKTRESMSFLDIRFSNGVLEIPHITLDDLHTDLFLNFVAFEQCYSHSPRHITSYAAFMSCLVRSPIDAAFLRDHNIIEDYLGNDKEVANFFRNLGKDVPFDIDECYLHKHFNDVNEYQRNSWHVRWAGFRFKYFDTPWSFLSALAAVILLLFTAIQTFFAVWAYVHPPLSAGGGKPWA